MEPKMQMWLPNPYFSTEGAQIEIEKVANKAREAINSAQNLSQEEKKQLLHSLENQPPMTPPDNASEAQIIWIEIGFIRDFIKKNLGIEI